MKGQVGKKRGVQVFISGRKAAGEAMPGALPEETTPNPTGPRLAWKQERAGISPRRRLLFKIFKII